MDGSDMTTDSVPDGHKIIQEGLAKILYPDDEDGDVPVSTPQRNLIGPRRPLWSAQVQLLNFLHNFRHFTIRHKYLIVIYHVLY